jgi:hypothetical protein
VWETTPPVESEQLPVTCFAQASKSLILTCPSGNRGGEPRPSPRVRVIDRVVGQRVSVVHELCILKMVLGTVVWYALFGVVVDICHSPRAPNDFAPLPLDAVGPDPSLEKLSRIWVHNQPPNNQTTMFCSSPDQPADNPFQYLALPRLRELARQHLPLVADNYRQVSCPPAPPALCTAPKLASQRFFLFCFLLVGSVHFFCARCPPPHATCHMRTCV